MFVILYSLIFNIKCVNVIGYVNIGYKIFGYFKRNTNVKNIWNINSNKAKKVYKLIAYSTTLSSEKKLPLINQATRDNKYCSPIKDFINFK